MFEELSSQLASGLSGIDNVIQAQIELRKDQSRTFRGQWAGNNEITKSISSIKDVTKVIAHSCVKLALVLRASPSNAALKSLLDELHKQVDILLAHYHNILGYPLSECLFDTVSRATRTFLTHLKDLINAVQTKQLGSFDYMVGMVDKISQDIGKLPDSNRLAYRLLFVDECKIMKETVQEFKAYLEEAAEKAEAALANAMENTTLDAVADNTKQPQEDEGEAEEEDPDYFEGDDEEDGNLDYTAAEVRVVEDCVKLLGKALGCVKHGLQISTDMCDSANPTSTTTVFASASAVSPAMAAFSEQWIAQLAQASQGLKKSVLDLGAELYPPFESDCSVITEHFATLHGQCAAYLQLLDAEMLRSLQTAEHGAKIAQLRSDVADCQLRSA